VIGRQVMAISIWPLYRHLAIIKCF